MVNRHCMNDEDMKKLEKLTLAPYIQLAICLVDKPRKSCFNMFRHQMATLGILFDYGYTDSILLKASVIHDVVEDIPDFDQNRILRLQDGQNVLNLVLEVSKRKGEKKETFLKRIKESGSDNAKILKSADRISNLYDLGFLTDKSFIQRYLSESEKFIIPIAEDVNKYMVIEINDLIISRKSMLSKLV